MFPVAVQPFFPFAITSRLAVGQALEVRLTCETYSTTLYGEVPLVDAVATYDAETGRTAIFLVNRSLDAATSVAVDVSQLGDVAVLESHTLADADIYAKNTLVEPDMSVRGLKMPRTARNRRPTWRRSSPSFAI